MPFDSMTVTARLTLPVPSVQPGATAAVLPNTLDYGRHLYLPRRSTLVLNDARGSVIAVDRGCLWVTLEGDPRDIILARGMRFVVDRNGRTVLAAEEDSRVRLIPQASAGERIAARLRRAGADALQRWSRALASKVVPYY